MCEVWHEEFAKIKKTNYIVKIEMFVLEMRKKKRRSFRLNCHLPQISSLFAKLSLIKISLILTPEASITGLMSTNIQHRRKRNGCPCGGAISASCCQFIAPSKQINCLPSRKKTQKSTFADPAKNVSEEQKYKIKSFFFKKKI